MYRTSKPEPTRVSVSEARHGFADLVNRVAYGNARITVARHGRDLVAIVPMADVGRLQAMEAGAASNASPPIPATAAPTRPGSTGPRA